VWVVGICEFGNKLSGFGFLRGIEYLYSGFFQLFKKYFEMTLARCVFEKVQGMLLKLIIHEFVSSDFSGDEVLYKALEPIIFSLQTAYDI
jgi:hypothetical protein